MAREAEPRKTDSVFDFLYADHSRIDLYLSQFSDFGNLTSLVHSRGERSDLRVTGGVPGVASGASTGEESSGIQRHFDPQWAQVLSFLDETNARGMMRKGVDQAPIGSLLLASGKLYIVNMHAFARTWGAISETATDQPKGNRRERRAAVRRKPEPTADSGGLRILASLEQPIYAVLLSGDHRIWSMLNPDYLVGGATDLNLKHGLRVAGEWHVLGILDCEPGSGDVTADEIGRLCGGGQNEFSDHAIVLWREFREVLGRPVDCWGLTPLVIMREVA